MHPPGDQKTAAAVGSRDSARRTNDPPPFRANNELALHVADPVSAATFYERILGAHVVDRAPDCIEVASGALRLFLLRDPAPTHDVVVPFEASAGPDVCGARFEGREDRARRLC